MPGRNGVLLLVIRDAGLRSTLAARLSMAGADVMTAEDFSDLRLERCMRGPGALVIDRAIVEAQPANWLEMVGDDRRWRDIIVLVDGAERPAQADGRIRFVERRAAAAGILDALQSPAG